VQEPELRLDEEQEEDAGSPRVQKVLQKVQESYSSQRDQVRELPIGDFRLPIEECETPCKSAIANRKSAITAGV